LSINSENKYYFKKTHFLQLIISPFHLRSSLLGGFLPPTPPRKGLLRLCKPRQVRLAAKSSHNLHKLSHRIASQLLNALDFKNKLTSAHCVMSAKRTLRTGYESRHCLLWIAKAKQAFAQESKRAKSPLEKRASQYIQKEYFINKNSY